MKAAAIVLAALAGAWGAVRLARRLRDQELLLDGHLFLHDHSHSRP